MDTDQRPPRDPRDPAPHQAPPPPLAAGHRPDQSGRIVVALVLIALGVIFLTGNLVSVGGLLFLGLGLAFLIARFLTGAYGLAVPAGVLLGFGGFVALENADLLPGAGGGWFFIMLGLGFLAVYLIGWRPAAIWPFFPATALVGFGLFTQGMLDLGPLAQFAWLGAYWPVALVAIGLWLLARDRLPEATRQPLAALGVLLLVAYGVVAGGAALASAGATLTGQEFRVNVPGFGNAPFTETIELSAPIAPGETLSVNNPAGRTVIRAGGGNEVRVTATIHRWTEGQRLDVQLVPSASGVSLTSSSNVELGRQPYADYTIEVPPVTTIQGRSASGAIQVDDIDNPVDVESMSGGLRVEDAGGAVTARSASGSIRVEEARGPLTASAASGSIEATDIGDVRDISTSSGGIRLSGVFTHDARVSSTSGSVRIDFDRESSVRISASTTSGSISAGDLDLRDRQATDRRLSGQLGLGAGHLVIETTSGSIRLGQ